MTPGPAAAALRRAVALHRAGRLDEAEPLYRAILERDPANPDALHFLGLLTHQRGDAAAAIELIERATRQAPGYADAHNNLGNLLRIAGRFEDAERAYRRAIALRPDDVSAHSNLGAALKAQGRLDAAEAALRRALALDDRHVPALTNMGHLLTRLGRTREALGHYFAAVAFDPDNPDGPRVLGSAYQAVGDIDKAREVYRDWLSRKPDDPVAQHLLAACSSDEPPERATDAFVRTTFDRLADGFDEHLAHLEYRAPALVEAAFARAWGAPHAALAVLDAGCGTGLCGPFLRPYARALVGVDLSPGMLRRAAERRLYDRLVEGELTGTLRAEPRAHDAIVSADTLCYFGRLDEVLAAASGALRPQGRLIFTVEQGSEDAGPGYRLESHGRYVHSEAYVRAALAGAGLQARSLSVDALRNEAGRPVAGLVVDAGTP